MNILRFLIPTACPGCGQEALSSMQMSCTQCERQLYDSVLQSRKRCHVCFANADQMQKSCTQQAFCQGRRIFFDKHISLYALNKHWRKFLYSWKFANQRYLYRIFLPDLLQPKTIPPKEIAPECSLMIDETPMKEKAATGGVSETAQRWLDWPIERVGYIAGGVKNKHTRNFQPCADIACCIAQYYGVDWGADIVKTKQHQQSQKSFPDRFFTIHNAFALSADFPTPPPQHYLLVEDVYTTGATANEASRILKKRGVSHVYVLSMLKAHS